MSNLTRTSRPHDVFAQFRHEMDETFKHWLGRTSAGLADWSVEGVFTPYELKETESEYIVKLDVPGMTEKDINVSYQGDTLTVQGERKEVKTEEKGAMRYTERSYGSFLRTIAMPAPVKADEIRARQKNGVMEIHLPKAQKSPTREIKIESGT